MKKILIPLALVGLAFVASACGAASSLLPNIGGNTGNTVSELWADVPRMDGFTNSDLQIPLMAQIFMQTMISQASDGAGSGDAAAFTTSHSMAEIQAFYSSERMGATGWNTGEAATCFSGEEQGVQDVGLFCAFAKEAGSAETVLVLIATPGDGGQNNVFFVRLEAQATPAP